MYVSPNFKTKKALKEAVAAGKDVRVLDGMYPTPKDGSGCAEGPHFPEPHKWYASITWKDFLVKTVK